MECCQWRTGVETRRLHRAAGVPIKVIAGMMGISKNTVRKALGDGGPPKYERVVRVSRGSMTPSHDSGSCCECRR